MKASKKRGFTIIELVIVIAVIAILAAVLIPTFSNVIQKAKEANDTIMVKTMNTALVNDSNLNGGKKHTTMSDALTAAKSAGYDVTKIRNTANNNEILWDSVSDCFVYMKKGEITYIPDSKDSAADTSKLYNYYRIVDNAAAVAASDYSTYMASTTESGAIVAKAGFDAGENTAITSVTYANTASAQNVIIRTNGGKLTVNGNSATDISHYGLVAELTINEVATHSYHEYGVAIVAKAAKGHIEVVGDGAILNAYNLQDGTASWDGVEPASGVYTDPATECTEHDYGKVMYYDYVVDGNASRIRYLVCSKCHKVSIVLDTNTITVTPSTIQSVLDGIDPVTGKYFSISGKTIHLTAGNYDKLYIRPHKNSIADTVYYNGDVKNQEGKTSVSVNNLAESGTHTYYRTLEDVVFEGEEGVKMVGFETVQGHIYGTASNPITDYVTGKTTSDTNGSYYSYLTLRKLSFRNIEFTDTVTIGSYYNTNQQIEETSFYYCAFTSKSNDHGIRVVGANSSCGKLIIDHCNISAPGFERTGLYITSTSGEIIISNNTFANCNYNAIQIGTGDNNVEGKLTVEIYGNKFSATTADVINLFGNYPEGATITIENNEFAKPTGKDSSGNDRKYIKNRKTEINAYVGVNKYYDANGKEVTVSDVTTDAMFENCVPKN